MNCRIALAAATLVIVSGCAAGGGDYPSLMPRPIEQRSAAEPAQPQAKATPDADLDAAIAKARDMLQAAAHDFALAATRTNTLVQAAAKADIGSDAWIDAQTALADLDGYRAQSLSTLSTLDDRSIARAQKLAPPYPALDKARADAQAQAASESATIAKLQARLPGG